MKKFICVISFLWCGLAVAQSKDDPIQLSDSSWKELTKELDYTDFNKKPSTSASRSTPDWNPDFSALKPLLFGFVIILAGVLIFFIIKGLLKQNKGTNKVRLEARNISDAEDNLPDVALDHIYKEALGKSDYKLALRIKFLMVLQQMIDREMVIWRKRKTNQQYIREIHQPNLKIHFKSIANIYDDAWYGPAALTKERYLQIEQQIESLNHKLHEEQK